ncbi:MAG: indole-3-glycerol phosphate synthase TrpC [Oscillospiraceae bacterium]
MQTILQTIADHARIRVENDKKKLPTDALKELCSGAGSCGGGAFVSALKKPGMSFICEIKKASPSKGVISEDFPYLDIAREYESAGAECISCLTEPKWFLGSDDIFRGIRSIVKTPMLRKDFVVDEYQIYQASLMGANAVLLICAILDTGTVARYLKLCSDLGLAAVVEAHDSCEIESAVSAGAEIIGVNNRNLKDFSVDVNNSGRLRALVPDNVIYVAESGIKTPEEVRALERESVDAVLIGETLMRSRDKGKMLRALRGES